MLFVILLLFWLYAKHIVLYELYKIRTNHVQVWELNWIIILTLIS